MWIEFNLSEEEMAALEEFCMALSTMPTFYDITPIIKKIVSSYRHSSKPARNSSILSMRKQGLTYDKIAEHFHISEERVRQICIKEDRKQELLKKCYDDIKSSDYNNFYTCLLKASISLEIPTSLVTRTYNSLNRAGILKEMEQQHTTLDSYSDEYLLSIYHFGLRSLDLSRKANEFYKRSIEKSNDQ